MSCMFNIIEQLDVAISSRDERAMDHKSQSSLAAVSVSISELGDCQLDQKISLSSLAKASSPLYYAWIGTASALVYGSFDILPWLTNS